MWTGYYAHTKKYIDKGLIPVSISNSTPKYLKMNKIDIFVPDWNLVQRYKSGYTSEADYIREYCSSTFNKIRDVLSTKEGLTLEDYICNLLMLEDREDINNVILLCYERTDAFCHRHFLRNLLVVDFNIHILEYEI